MKYVPPPAGEDEEEKPGDTFEGHMEAGKREGHGKYTWSSGAVYEGTYADNKKGGKGRLTMPDKSVYEGAFAACGRSGSCAWGTWGVEALSSFSDFSTGNGVCTSQATLSRTRWRAVAGTCTATATCTRGSSVRGNGKEPELTITR